MGASAGSLSNLILISSGASALSGLASSVNQSSALRAQGGFESRMLGQNAGLLEGRAQEALRLGEEDALRYGQRVNQVRGAQRAAMAAQGLDLSTGTPAAIQAETDRLGELDMLAIRNNAAREAFGYEVEAGQARTDAKLSKRLARQQGRQTLITGGLGFLRDAAVGYDTYKRSLPNPRFLPVGGPLGMLGMVKNPSYRKSR